MPKERTMVVTLTVAVTVAVAVPVAVALGKGGGEHCRGGLYAIPTALACQLAEETAAKLLRQLSGTGQQRSEGIGH
jgi:hypothetical protein